jgi:hypothetical protein
MAAEFVTRHELTWQQRFLAVAALANSIEAVSFSRSNPL